MNEITQEVKNGFGSTSTTIAEQNNYYGITPEKACDMALKLFYDNFPKMQLEAEKLVNERINEFCSKLIEKLGQNKFDNYEVFADPDIQYVLYESQKSYARNGDKDSLKNLIFLLGERCNSTNRDIKLLTLNEAIITSQKLSSEHLSILSVIFLLRYSDDKDSVKDLKTLNEYLNNIVIPFIQNPKITETFQNIIITSTDTLHLNHLGCTYIESLGFELGYLFSQKYPKMFPIKNDKTEYLGLSKMLSKDSDIIIEDLFGNEVNLREYISKNISNVEYLFSFFNKIGNISLTNVGIAIAIANIQNKLGCSIDMSIWIN